MTSARPAPAPGTFVPMLLALFVLSGAAGLVYQALWSHYLGLTLGHAAYAQSLVLAIFMGGMALGAWLASRLGGRWSRLLLAYAVTEAAIGVFGLAFNPLFVTYAGLSEHSVLPALGDGFAGQLYPWLSATLLLLPPCILLGATFPLLSAGCLRAAPGGQARALGGLYFANSLGAAAGALLATFVLLPRLGMPGAMACAGIANLVVAALSAWLSWRVESPRIQRPPAIAASPNAGAGATHGDTARRAVLWAALASGACSFAYEIGWVRLLNQALGSTMHSFELMLAAFLLGLAGGGAFVQRRGDRLRDPLRAAALAQIAMGIAAALSLLVLGNAFEWTGTLLRALARNDHGYTLFLAGSAGIALLVMLPAAFFAGTTLPLFTMALLRGGSGEAGIGRLYAANTVGAIVGVLATTHLLIPLLGVHGVLVLAALVDALIGFWLLAQSHAEPAPRRIGALALLTAAALLVAAIWGRPDPRAQLSGVFRNGFARLGEQLQIEFLRDGKTATIGVVRAPDTGSRSLLTNGKSDGAMADRIDAPPAGDELTMITLGALPLALHPAPRQIGVIGWGLGMSTNTVLGSAQVERVETVEIEPAVLAASRLFATRIPRALHDPRSTVHYDDARRFFASGQRRYDAIISEPSNPWVSGVSGLFTTQFYRFLHDHLADDGVLVQWLQTYEIDDALAAQIIASVLEVFPDAGIYLAQDNDLAIVACRTHCPEGSIAPLQQGALRFETARIGLDSDAALALRRIGGHALLRTYVAALQARPHDDFHPTIALRAPATRFRGDRAETLQRLADNGMPVLDLLEGRIPAPAATAIPALPGHRLTQARSRAIALASAMREGRRDSRLGVRANDSDAAELALQALLGASRAMVDDPATWAEAVTQLAEATIGHLPAQDLHGVWIAPAWIAIDQQPPLVRGILAMYAAAAARDAAAMRRTGEAVLQQPQALPLQLQEQALLIAQLGAIGSGHPEQVEALHEGYGSALPASDALRMVRHVVRIRALELAWPARDAANGAKPTQGP